MLPVIVFAHGAGAPSSHPWMRGWAARLGVCGSVSSFDYPYMQNGRKTPDRADKLLAAHADAVTEAQAANPGAPLVIAGKSMGGRMGCHLAAQWAAAGNHTVKALVCFGYPLRSAGSGKSRAEVLLEVKAPILFVQGSRDALCPLPELQAVLPQRKAPSELHVVEQGDHSLMVAKRTLTANNETQADVDARILASVQNFLQRHVR